MGVQWTPYVEMRDGRVGEYLGRCDLTRRHRVGTWKDSRNGQWVDRRGLDADQLKSLSYTTWLLDDAGHCRGDKAPCGEDYAAAA